MAARGHTTLDRSIKLVKSFLAPLLALIVLFPTLPMNRLAVLALVGSVGLVIAEPVRSEVQKDTAHYVKVCQTMRAAFICQAYARMAEMKKEAIRLFDLGYEAASEFYQSRYKMSWHVRKELPATSWLWIEGPGNRDFKIGTFFESTVEPAYERVEAAACTLSVIKTFGTSASPLLPWTQMLSLPN